MENQDGMMTGVWGGPGLLMLALYAVILVMPFWKLWSPWQQGCCVTVAAE